MKKVYITFGGQKYDGIIEKIVNNAPRFGSDDVWVYDDRWLMGTSLYRDHRWLWECRGPGNPDSGRGFGWFAWKPFVMADALSRCDPGDIVMFTDADTYPVADFSMLYAECARIGGSMLFAAQGCCNRQWCKRDCFIVMGLDEPKYHDADHAVARFFLFQAGAPRVDEFLAEWQGYCVDSYATTFDVSTLGEELPGFREHRTEQAILTNLAHKYGHHLYREASQEGNWALDLGVDAELYQQLFEQVWCDGSREPVGSRFFHVPGESR